MVKKNSNFAFKGDGKVDRAIRMKNPDSHIYLYAKHHYKQSNTILDLRKITAHRCGCELKYVTCADVISILSSIAFEHMKQDSHFIDFISNSFRSESRKAGKFTNRYASKTAILRSLLKILTFVRVKDDSGKVLLELDEPDFTILPPRE